MKPWTTRLVAHASSKERQVRGAAAALQQIGTRKQQPGYGLHNVISIENNCFRCGIIQELLGGSTKSTIMDGNPKKNAMATRNPRGAKYDMRTKGWQQKLPHAADNWKHENI